MTLEQKELKFDELVVLFGIAVHIFGAKKKNCYHMISLISELKS